MAPSGAEDPNQEVYEKIFSDLSAMTDANGRALKVTSIASPGLVRDDDGRIIPASHMNFYIGNDVVVVPIYGTTYDDLAVSQLADCFPNRKTVGVSAKAILTGGGSFHCITQQEPL
jgi:agmatine deiminase